MSTSVFHNQSAVCSWVGKRNSTPLSMQFSVRRNLRNYSRSGSLYMALEVLENHSSAASLHRTTAIGEPTCPTAIQNLIDIVSGPSSGSMRPLQKAQRNHFQESQE